MCSLSFFFFFFQAEDGIRDAQESRGLGDVYKRQDLNGQLTPVAIGRAAPNHAEEENKGNTTGQEEDRRDEEAAGSECFGLPAGMQSPIGPSTPVAEPKMEIQPHGPWRYAEDTPLHTACSQADLKSVQKVLNRQPEQISAKARDGDLPIHRAAASRSPEACKIVRHLLDLAPEQASSAGFDGELPLHVACACLLYTSDAADEEDSVDLGGRRIIKKKKKKKCGANEMEIRINEYR
eukprot:TRINITY_DN11817_c0_g1_i3.p1 TRINITY_DN11817_c0_g1~~TRINITY_DN11817_c0_g1_i3.p1  ORF type:complete len:236 (-),score=80.33 TRINITY_DN11817_c0_g1_i3:47-754(-)